jgi:hypothetical protein
MAIRLPSARFEQGDPRPIGFQVDLQADHIDRAGEALDVLARRINASSTGTLELRVCLCHVRYMPGLPFELFGFHVPAIEESGRFVDPWDPDAELRYALVVNHPADIQVETSLALLFQVLERHRVVEAARRRGDVTSIDKQAAEADDRADKEFLDCMRFGWQKAAEAVALKAKDAAVQLTVRYQRDPFNGREELTRRIPTLRTAYNDLATVRRAIDNTVSMIGGSHPQIRWASAPSRLREHLQTDLAALGIRQFMNQTTRDGEVCGNGYLVSSHGADLSPYCLRPEDVKIEASDRFLLVKNGEWREIQNVVHIRGIDQIDSLYGISVLEPVIYAVDQTRLFQSTKQLAEQALTDAQLESRWTWAQGSLAFADRGMDQLDQILSRLLGFTRDRLPAAREDLYFPGQEEMR